jgi:hypothetical protein
MIHLIVKYDVQCCLFPFSLHSFSPILFIPACHRLFPLFCFQENENEDGSEDEIGGQE